MKRNRIFAALLALCLLLGTSALALGPDDLYAPGVLAQWYNQYMAEYNASYFRGAFSEDDLYDAFRLARLDGSEADSYANGEGSCLLTVDPAGAMDVWFDVDAFHGVQAQAFFTMSVEDLLDYLGGSAEGFFAWSIADESVYPSGTFRCDAFTCSVTDEGDAFGDGNWWIHYSIR